MNYTSMCLVLITVKSCGPIIKFKTNYLIKKIYASITDNINVIRSGTSGKTLNFSHEWKKSQIFNKDECKYLFLPFQLKNKA
jgi:hypothetical protein